VGVSGSADGQGTAASFIGPSDIVVDSSGNLYVADTHTHLIRKIDPSGNVTTLAGQAGVSGSADGQGTAASFSYPFGIAVDSSGNLYVADVGNHLIRKIDPSGNVTTLAGQGVRGSADGQGTAASFELPTDIAVDSSGNLYVADHHNHLIRKIDPSGNVTTLAGQVGVSGSADGQGTAASFNSPWSIAVDSSGNLYVSDFDNHLIRKIDPSGNVTTLAGQAGVQGSADGQGATASFDKPFGIAVDSSGNLYVAEEGNHLIRKLTGVVTGNVETTSCEPEWNTGQNFFGISLSFYNQHSAIFEVGRSIQVDGETYYIDAINVPTNCNAGVALVYVADSESSADGSSGTVGGTLRSDLDNTSTWQL